MQHQWELALPLTCPWEKLLLLEIQACVFFNAKTASDVTFQKVALSVSRAQDMQHVTVYCPGEDVPPLDFSGPLLFPRKKKDHKC